MLNSFANVEILDCSTVKQCREFSLQCAPTEQAIEFGQHDTQARDREEIAYDTFVGKLGEAAALAFFKQIDPSLALDFDIYDRGQWDKFDFKVKGWVIDVKCTKYGINFLIEWSKLQFRADAGEIPHFFLLTKLQNGQEVRKILQGGKAKPIAVQLVGYVDSCDLQQGSTKVITLRKGQNIPGTTTSLSADNFCIPITALAHDWEGWSHQLETERPFSLADYQPPYSSCPRVEKRPSTLPGPFPARHTLLLSGIEADQVPLETLEQYVLAGIRVIVFSKKENASRFLALVKKYPRESFQFFPVEGEPPALRVEDGHQTVEETARFNRLCAMPMQKLFNREQYDVEHADTHRMIVVKASAGTGKTSVMTDRVMALLAMDDTLQPSDIAIVTFTNKATASMQAKIQRRLENLVELTGKKRWRDCLESLGELRISTIDSFFKDLLATEGSALGFGPSVDISGLVQVKKQIIFDILGEMYSITPKKKIDFLEENVLTLEEFVQKTLILWDKLHQRGFFGKDFIRLDFSGGRDDDSQRLGQRFKTVLVKAEERYQSEKLAHNALMVSDLKAAADALTRLRINKLHRPPYRYIFIDEFQDTDNSQIRCFVWLQKMMRCQLFVVGDVKQSIYRFRGAEESAFEELKRQLSYFNRLKSTDIVEFILSCNYRTSAQVLSPLNRLFRSWAEAAAKLLHWDSDARPAIEEAGEIHCERLPGRRRRSVATDSEAAVKVAKTWYQERRTNEICVLTRTNYQAQEFARACKAAGLPCIARLGGEFYKSQPVWDLIALLGALLYSDDPRRLFNFLTSPYSPTLPNVGEMFLQNGKTDQLLKTLKPLLDQMNWNQWLHRVRIEPIFPLIESLIAQLNPIGRYAARRRAGFEPYVHQLDEQMDIELYALNLEKLLGILYDSFKGSYPTLQVVFDFLDNKLKTDTEEELEWPQPGDSTDENGTPPCRIEVMTVHQSKGLEFETVFLPFTTFRFERDLREEEGVFNAVIAENPDKHISVVWQLMHRGNVLGNSCESFNDILNHEKEACCREEMRLLYVAMTRAKKNLVYFTPPGYEIPEDCWAQHLMGFKGGLS